MALKNLTENDLREGNFLNNFADFVSFDKESKTLKIKDLKLHSIDQNRGFLNRVQSAVSPSVQAENMIFENVEFEASNISLGVERKLTLKSCSIIGTQSFGGYPKEIEIIDCNIPNFNFDLYARSLTVIDSNIGKISIGLSGSDEIYVKTVNIQGKSSINSIKGLHFLLRNEVGTVIMFSQESRIIENAEESYRIMRLISDKFGDVVQSHIFHTNAIELYERRADKDTKMLLFFEKLTNNFGRSISRPISCMFIVNCLSISILLLLSDYFRIDNFGDLFGSAFNVSPWGSFVSEEIIKNGTRWESSLDSIRRVILAVLAYQTIVSARRFSFLKK